MTGTLKKTLVGVAVALACSGAQAANTTISGFGVTAAINDAGTFTSFTEGTYSPIGTPGLTSGGVEFVNWGTPISWNWLKAGGMDSPSFLGSNPRAGTTGPGFPAGSVANSFSAGGLSILQTFSIFSPGKLSVSVTITNVLGGDDGGSAIDGVMWGVGLDPDQGIDAGGSFDTDNTILGQNNAASVMAVDTVWGSGGTINLVNDTTSGAFTIAAFIDPTACCTPIDPAFALGAGQAAGFNTHGDHSISLAYSIGTIVDGGSATLGYSYIMTPIPEPETYAMLLAGLGLMGFMARRRQRSLAAA